MKYFEYLQDAETQQIFNAIQMEQPQTIAIILVHVDTDLAADILNMFSDNMKADIAIRISQLDNIPDILIKSVSNTLKSKIAPKGVKLGGIKAVADILKHFDK